MAVEKATLTEAEKEQLAEAAHQNEQQIKRCKDAMSGANWVLGELLLTNKDKKLWMVQNQSWTGFLASPEIAIEDTTARRLVRLTIARTSIDKGTPGVNWDGISATRLMRVWLPCVKMDEKYRVVTNVKEALELLEACRTLSLGDFNELLRGKKIEKETDTPDPAYKKDMIVFGEDGKTAIGNVSGVRATTTAQYVTIRLDHAQAKTPIKMEIKG